MKIYDDIFTQIGRVAIAHEWVLNSNNKCDYSKGRKIYGISYALSGEAEYKLSSGKRYKVKTGDIVYLSSNATYVIDIKGEYRHYTVNFDISECDRDKLCELGDISVLHLNDLKYFKNTFRELTEIWKKKRFGYEMRATACVYGMLTEFLNELRTNKLKGKGYFKILPAKEYIDEDCKREISISELARLCSMSETNFRRSFSAALGQTPLRYRDNARLTLAKEYLLSGFYSVSEVAELCGFEDPSYFGRFFKKYMGISPGQFKFK